MVLTKHILFNLVYKVLSFTPFVSTLQLGVNTFIIDSIYTDRISYMEDIYTTFTNLNTDITDLYPFSSSTDLCYVDADNSQNNPSGSSWSDAFSTIQECIDSLSTNGGEIWVKEGTYYPTDVPEWKTNIGKTGPQHRSFIMYENIRIYGGFDGSETVRENRNFYLNPTYLSCKIWTGPRPDDHVYCHQILNAADNSLVDGFIFIETQYESTRRRRRLSTDNALSPDIVISATSDEVGAGIYSNSTTINIVNSVFYALYSSSKGIDICIDFFVFFHFL